MRHRISEFKNIVAEFSQGAPRYLKYQLITKTLFAMVIMPVFWALANWLIKKSGQEVLTNSNFLKFLFSAPGFGLTVLFLLLVSVGILVEIGGFVLISNQLIHKTSESDYLTIIKASMKRLPKMFEIGSLLILIYVIVLAPFAHMGLRLSFLQELACPKFIENVIQSNGLYLIAWLSLALVALVFAVRWIFTFHFIMLSGCRSSEAMKISAQVVQKHFIYFLVEILALTLIGGILTVGFCLIWGTWVMVLTEIANLNNPWVRIGIMFLLLLQETFVLVVGLLIVPFEVHFCTRIVLGIKDRDDENLIPKMDSPVMAKTKQSLLDRMLSKPKIVSMVFLIGIGIVAMPLGYWFKELYNINNKIEVVGHRGAGAAAPENTLAAIKESIGLGAMRVEIDVQETQDGQIVLAHDKSFKRTARDSRLLANMTYKDILKLDVGKSFSNKFAGEKVSLLKDAMTLCAGKIKMNIELKGSKDQYHMAEHIITMIHENSMESEVMVTSLDIKVIAWIEKNHPEIETGFIYYLAFGDVSKLPADVLILEEGMANMKMLDAIHKASKKAVVWTVNDEEAMKEIIDQEIDGIITDNISTLKIIIKEKQGKSQKDIIRDLFLGQQGATIKKLCEETSKVL